MNIPIDATQRSGVARGKGEEGVRHVSGTQTQTHNSVRWKGNGPHLV